MTIGIYNPYLDALGGGERYVLTLASHWSNNHDVRLFWDDNTIIDKALERLNIDLSKVKVTQNIFRGKNILKKLFLTKKYDVIFFLSDGSIPTSLATRNLLHFQVPFQNIPLNRLKLRRFQKIICNSQFTRDNLPYELSSRTEVIYPPVDTASFRQKTKKKYIVSVGRFSSHFQAKKQEVLIDALRFARFHHKLPIWELVFAGGLMPGDKSYYEELQRKARGLPIVFMPNVPYEKLVDLYAHASIYWHAAGFGETNPELMEHFGITTVEAMASGCVPIVYNGGGQPEIVEDGQNGYLWETVGELVEKTVEVAKNWSVATLREEAKKKAWEFDKKRFCDAFDRILAELI